MSGAAAILVLTAAQKYWAIKAYQIGETNGLGYTLSAISWQESSFCRYKVNSWSRGCTGLKRKTARIFDSNVTRRQLTDDNERNLRDGLSYFEYCQTNTDTWRQAVACFHYGLPVESEMGDAQINSDPYVLAIIAKVKALQSLPQDIQ